MRVHRQGGDVPGVGASLVGDRPAPRMLPLPMAGEGPGVRVGGAWGVRWSYAEVPIAGGGEGPGVRVGEVGWCFALYSALNRIA